MENEKAPSAVQQEVARLAARMVDLFMSKRDWRLLQAYLATGLTPEEIEKLKAERAVKENGEHNQQLPDTEDLRHRRGAGDAGCGPARRPA